MDFKNILPKKKEESEYFWSLIIEPEWASAGVWRIKDGKVQVIAVSPPAAWNLDEELVSACDASCSSIVQSFPEDISPPEKTVFGVISSWVDGGEIKPEYLSRIKKICSELSLTPVGFVVMAEALSNYLKSEEGGGMNAIFLGISRENLELSIFRLGKLTGVSQIARSVSVVDDVAEGLSRFYTGEAYPSRIILFNSKEGELEDIKQELIKADWESFQNIKFLHTPKVEILLPDKKVYAVCLAGGVEMGGVQNVTPDKSIGDSDDGNLRHQTISEEIETNNLNENVKEPSENISPEDFGFSIDEENTKDPYENFKSKSENIVSEKEIGVEKPPELAGNKDYHVDRQNKSFAFFSRLLNVHKLSQSSAKYKFSSVKPLFLSLIIIPVLFIGLLSFWWFFPKVEIEIYVSPKNINEEVDISVDDKLESPDYENLIIPGEIVSQTMSGEKSIATTGTRVVGDKAVGEITIYRSGNEISLSKNTLVKGPGGLNFSLDNDITVASGSVLTRGITKAKITAKEIGAQYNLASGTTFTLSNYSNSDMEAVNETSFSGGSSREVSAVSESDQKRLLEDLLKEVQGDLEFAMKSDVKEDAILIGESINTSIVEKEYDKKIGDEATSLKLKIDVKAEGLVVQKDEIEAIGTSYLKSSVPSGYTLESDQIESKFTYKNQKDNIHNLELIVSADVLPQIDIDGVRKNITGKYPEAAEKYMSENIPGYVRSVSDFSNFNLPGWFGVLPHISKNIIISISAEN